MQRQPTTDTPPQELPETHTMAKWTPFPHAGGYQFDAASVKKHWALILWI